MHWCIDFTCTLVGYTALLLAAMPRRAIRSSFSRDKEPLPVLLFLTVLNELADSHVFQDLSRSNEGSHIASGARALSLKRRWFRSAHRLRIYRKRARTCSHRPIDQWRCFRITIWTIANTAGRMSIWDWGSDSWETAWMNIFKNLWLSELRSLGLISHLWKNPDRYPVTKDSHWSLVIDVDSDTIRFLARISFPRILRRDLFKIFLACSLLGRIYAMFRMEDASWKEAEPQ